MITVDTKGMSKTAVLFDLGGTLVEYYDTGEFLPILEAAIREASRYLHQRSIELPEWDELWRRTLAENYEAKDYRVRPLEDRLCRIFALEEGEGATSTMRDMCRLFLGPIFRRARVYYDAMPVLAELRTAGIRTCIVSNTPWGSPADLWREELDRLGLTPWVEDAVFCRDAGWRKPATPILSVTIQRLGLEIGECLFVGDDPRWDVAGAQAMGMDVVLVDRKGRHPEVEVPRVSNLSRLRHLIVG